MFICFSCPSHTYHDSLNLNTMRLVLLKSNSVSPGVSTRSFANLFLFNMRGGYWEGTNSSNCDREVMFWLRRGFVPSTAQLHKELGMFRHGAFHLPDFVDLLTSLIFVLGHIGYVVQCIFFLSVLIWYTTGSLALHFKNWPDAIPVFDFQHSLICSVQLHTASIKKNKINTWRVFKAEQSGVLSLKCFWKVLQHVWYVAARKRLSRVQWN